MGFFIAPVAQLERRLSYTASQYLLDNLRARAEGETNGYARKDAKGIPHNFVPDLSVNRLLLDDKVGEKLAKATPHLGEEPLSSVSKRRLEVIMTGAIRTQVRLNSAGIKTPAGAINERVCPHCMQAQEETTEHILWECTAGADLRLLTKVYLDQVLLDSPARAGIPTDWAEWPPTLRAFGFIGLDPEVVLAVNELPTLRTKGPSLLIPIDYAPLSMWRSNNQSLRRRKQNRVLSQSYQHELAG